MISRNLVAVTILLAVVGVWALASGGDGGSVGIGSGGPVVGVDLDAPLDRPETRRVGSSAREPDGCKEDLACIANARVDDAGELCKPEVEKLAGAHDFKWDKGRRLTRYKWLDGTDKMIILYAGDAIRIQNQYGAWIRHIYYCEYGIWTHRALRVTGGPGKLDS